MIINVMLRFFKAPKAPNLDSTRQMMLQQCVYLDRSIQRLMRVCRLGKKRSQRIFARNEDVAQGRAPSTVAAVHKTRSCLQLVHVQGVHTSTSGATSNLRWTMLHWAGSYIVGAFCNDRWPRKIAAQEAPRSLRVSR